MLTNTKSQDIDTINWSVQWRTLYVGYTYLQEQVTEITLITFRSPSRKLDKKEKNEKKLEKQLQPLLPLRETLIAIA